MLKFAADENFNNDILRGLLRRKPNLDIVRVQDSEAAEADDTIVLEWATHNGRILLTHDVNTLIYEAYRRIEAGLLMPGVLEVNQALPVGIAIENILLVIECSFEDEWENQVRYA